MNFGGQQHKYRSKQGGTHAAVDVQESTSQLLEEKSVIHLLHIQCIISKGNYPRDPSRYPEMSFEATTL